MHPLLVAILFLGVASYASASVFTDVLGLDCRKEKTECDVIHHCCGELQCYYANGLNALKTRTGLCVECVDSGLSCLRDEQCCQPAGEDEEQLLCQKKHRFHLNGVCQTLLRDHSKCYKDSQCLHDNCVKPHFWHMFGRCEQETNVLEP